MSIIRDLTYNDYKYCTKCKKYLHLRNFSSKHKLITLTCLKCRSVDNVKYIVYFQNIHEKILQDLNISNITKFDIYTLYQNQKKRCYICNKKIFIKLTYVNKFNKSNMFENNMYICCPTCYVLMEDYDMVDFNIFNNFLQLYYYYSLIGSAR